MENTIMKSTVTKLANKAININLDALQASFENTLNLQNVIQLKNKAVSVSPPLMSWQWTKVINS